MKLIYILVQILLIISLVQSSDFVNRFITCKNSCDADRTNNLQNYMNDMTMSDIEIMKQSWDVFQKCAYNVDGANAGTTSQHASCATYASSDTTDAQVSQYRKNLWGCFKGCGVGQFDTAPNENWESCMSVCKGELYSDPKYSQYADCSNQCTPKFSQDLIQEYISDLEGLQALMLKMTPAMNCIDTDTKIEACKKLQSFQGDFEAEPDYFENQVVCSKQCFSQNEIYSEDVGTAFPNFFKCQVQCANNKLGLSLSENVFESKNSHSQIIQTGIIMTIALLLIAF